MPAHLGKIAHRPDHSRGHVTRVRARESNPRQAVDLLQPLQQSREIAAIVVWRLVVVDDLSEQLDFPGARVDRVARLGDDVGSRPHALVAARVRDDAEGAEFVAAFDDGDVGLDGIEASRDAKRERDVAERVEIEDRRRTVGSVNRAVHEYRETLQVLRADDHVHRVRTREDPVALLLRHAAGDGDDRPRAFLDRHLTELAKTREEFFLGPLAHAAGVDDDDVCVAIVGRGLVARLLEESGHALGVVHVHLTTVRFDQVFSRHAFAFAFRFMFAFASSL